LHASVSKFEVQAGELELSLSLNFYCYIETSKLNNTKNAIGLSKLTIVPFPYRNY